jgi:hypothetical protein
VCIRLLLQVVKPKNPAEKGGDDDDDDDDVRFELPTFLATALVCGIPTGEARVSST